MATNDFCKEQRAWLVSLIGFQLLYQCICHEKKIVFDLTISDILDQAPKYKDYCFSLGSFSFQGWILVVVLIVSSSPCSLVGSCCSNVWSNISNVTKYEKNISSTLVLYQKFWKWIIFPSKVLQKSVVRNWL